jgi:hypothetical protein
MPGESKFKRGDKVILLECWDEILIEDCPEGYTTGTVEQVYGDYGHGRSYLISLETSTHYSDENISDYVYTAPEIRLVSFDVFSSKMRD